jgi:hypothetical protein
MFPRLPHFINKKTTLRIVFDAEGMAEFRRNSVIKSFIPISDIFGSYLTALNLTNNLRLQWIFNQIKREI